MITEIRREELLRKRKQKGMSQSDVAYYLQVSPTLYQRIEAGYLRPRQEIAAKLTEMFQLPDGYFGGER